MACKSLIILLLGKKKKITKYLPHLVMPSSIQHWQIRLCHPPSDLCLGHFWQCQIWRLAVSLRDLYSIGKANYFHFLQPKTKIQVDLQYLFLSVPAQSKLSTKTVLVTAENSNIGVRLIIRCIIWYNQLIPSIQYSESEWKIATTKVNTI